MSTSTKSKNLGLILAVASAGLPWASGYRQQFLPLAQPGTTAGLGQYMLEPLLESAGLWIGPRYQLEDDPRFSQVIPYVVAKVGGKVLAYTRGAEGGEARLHGMVSVGVGGHVDFEGVVTKPARFEIDAEQTLYYTAIRELDEEIGSPTNRNQWQPVLKGLLATRGTPVGDVHVGVVYTITLDELPPRVENTMVDVQAMSVDELSALNEQGRLEPWTKALLPFLASF